MANQFILQSTGSQIKGREMSGNKVKQSTPAAGTCKIHNQERKGGANKTNQKEGFFWSYGRYTNIYMHITKQPKYLYNFFWLYITNVRVPTT